MITYLVMINDYKLLLRICYLHGLIVIWHTPANREETALRITFIQNGSLMNYGL